MELWDLYKPGPRLHQADVRESKKRRMPSSITFFRVVAGAVLLLAGVELLACDLVLPATCEIAGIPDDGGSSNPTDGDSCLCCCFHIIVKPQIDLTPTIEIATAFILGQCAPPSAESPNIYHPPRV